MSVRAWPVAGMVAATFLAIIAACDSFAAADADDQPASDASSVTPGLPALDARTDGAPSTCGAIAPGESDGVVPPGQTDCGGVRVELATDPSHCGACEHSCLGSACDQGRCAVSEALADAAPASSYITPFALHDGAFYWVRHLTAPAGSEVVRGRAGQPQETLLASPLGTPVLATSITSDRLYVGRPNNLVVMIPLAKPADQVPFGGIDYPSPSGLVATPDALYVASAPLRHVSRTGLDASTVRLSEPEPGPHHLVFDGRAYWINTTADGLPTGEPGGVVEHDPATGLIRRLAPNGHPGALTKHRAHLYILDDRTGALTRQEPTAVKPETLGRWLGVRGMNDLLLAADDTGVYALIGGAVVKFPLCGGRPLLLFRGPATGLVLRETHVFVGEGNRILAIPK